MRAGGTIFMGLSALVLAMPIVVVCAAALNGGRSMFFRPANRRWRGLANFSSLNPSGRTL